MVLRPNIYPLCERTPHLVDLSYYRGSRTTPCLSALICTVFCVGKLQLLLMGLVPLSGALLLIVAAAPMPNTSTCSEKRSRPPPCSPIAEAWPDITCPVFSQLNGPFLHPSRRSNNTVVRFLLCGDPCMKIHSQGSRDSDKGPDILGSSQLVIAHQVHCL